MCTCQRSGDNWGDVIVIIRGLKLEKTGNRIERAGGPSVCLELGCVDVTVHILEVYEFDSHFTH